MPLRPFCHNGEPAETGCPPNKLAACAIRARPAELLPQQFVLCADSPNRWKLRTTRRAGPPPAHGRFRHCGALRLHALHHSGYGRGGDGRPKERRCHYPFPLQCSRLRTRSPSENFVRCMSPVMAHRVESLRCEGSDAIGAKRTCRERRERVDLTKMVESECDAVAVG